jgi:hypothetical protein
MLVNSNLQVFLKIVIHIPQISTSKVSSDLGRCKYKKYLNLIRGMLITQPGQLWVSASLTYGWLTDSAI